MAKRYAVTTIFLFTRWFSESVLISFTFFISIGNVESLLNTLRVSSSVKFLLQQRVIDLWSINDMGSIFLFKIIPVDSFIVFVFSITCEFQEFSFPNNALLTFFFFDIINQIIKRLFLRHVSSLYVLFSFSIFYPLISIYFVRILCLFLCFLLNLSRE